MEGEEERSEQEGSFSKASIPKRIAIVLAGGLVNIVFGLIVFFLLVSTLNGYPKDSGHMSNEIQELAQNYTAEEQGLKVGDKILEINDKKIRLQSDLEKELVKSQGNPVSIVVERDGRKFDLNYHPKEVKTKSTGIYLGKADDQELSSKIVMVYPDSPAAKEGIEENDIIEKVNGQEVNNDPYQVIELLNEATSDTITFTINRKGEQLEKVVTPQIQSTYYLGVVFKKADVNFINNLYYGFWDTVDFSFSIIDNLKLLFTGKVSTNQLMGPIGISEVVSKTSGIAEFLYMLALISLSLGVTNLLPFPPLDGGKVVILLIEAIRRKPLKESIEINIQMLGFALLIALSVYVAYHDIVRLF